MKKNGVFRFRLNPAGVPNGERVVMIHGLSRSALSMLRMGWRLSREGYEVLCYEYPSRSKDIKTHGLELARELEKITGNDSATTHFVTHSLGGIVLREALAVKQLKDSLCLGSAVMLAPPNQGSDTARMILKCLPAAKRVLRPLPELSSSPEAYVHRVPPLPEKMRLAVIAARSDGKVSVSRTHPARPGLHYEHMVVPGCHTFIMEKKAVVSATLAFLRQG